MSGAGPPTAPDNLLGADYAPRELLLAAAAWAVLAAFRVPLEKKRLTPAATATLRLLETALDPYAPWDRDKAGK